MFKMEVKIPFNKWSEERLEQGRKLCTSRNKIYGSVGDSFHSKSAVHFIKLIKPFPLWFVRDFLYQLEGANSPDEFVSVWKIIYRGRFNEDKVVYVHFFSNPFHEDKLLR